MPQPQTPPLHAAPGAQACPHAPQFAGSRGRSEHAPEHNVSEPVQAHSPAVQTVPAPHGCVQVPQFDGSVCVSAHDAPHRV